MPLLENDDDSLGGLMAESSSATTRWPALDTGSRKTATSSTSGSLQARQRQPTTDPFCCSRQEGLEAILAVMPSAKYPAWLAPPRPL
ncbi:hypothetical protein DSL92_07770 [Billgrantia gudaonensis]|uniref:Uncharacterized protein n=1 Tax=Billgrantia gudaonensis TaxID=376427 RepID=A0A3S0NWN4_9GAMM|nr:hypothetical protein DSL92_07770 [Halomonas gudaonensis]